MADKEIRDVRMPYTHIYPMAYGLVKGDRNKALALAYVTKRTISVYEASKTFDIPETTMRRLKNQMDKIIEDYV